MMESIEEVIAGTLVVFEDTVKGNDYKRWLPVFEEWLPRLAEMGWLEGVPRIRVAPTFERWPAWSSPYAQYLSYERDILIRSTHDGDYIERAKTIVHEAAHNAHYQIIFGDSSEYETKEEWYGLIDAVKEETDIGEPLQSRERELVEQGISEYGAKNPVEFVAEYASYKIVEGLETTLSMDYLYGYYNGPEIEVSH